MAVYVYDNKIFFHARLTGPGTKIHCYGKLRNFYFDSLAFPEKST